MKFSRQDTEIFVPDGTAAEQALSRATHVCVAAHHDDAEIMAFEGILACFGRRDRWFLPVILTDGAGSPRDGVYASLSDEEMRIVRRGEQKKAAVVGEYSAVVLLNHASATVKDASCSEPVEDLRTLFAACRPEVVYTHNLADKHDTHVAGVLRTIEALRGMALEARPRKLFGCEVWRSLDWLLERDKRIFDLGRHENLALSLIGLFDSQIAGGKRYDLATIGRRRANATYHESHSVDASQSLGIGMDLTPLVVDEKQEIAAFIAEYIDRFARDVEDRIARLS